MKPFRTMPVLLIAGLLFLIAGCSSPGQQIANPPVQTPATVPVMEPSAEVPGQTSFVLLSGLFSQGGPLPSQVSCTGAGIAPGLSWKNPPEGTKSFTLILEDPDAPRGTFTHWIVYNIPASVRELSGTLPDTAETGLNSAGSRIYAPPCPPGGTIHRYIFNLYALDAVISPAAGDRSSVLTSMQGHVLGIANITTTFQR